MIDKIEIQLVKPEGEAGWCDFCIHDKTSLEPYCRDISHGEVAEYAEAYAHLMVYYGYEEVALWTIPLDRNAVLMELQRIAKGAGEIVPFIQDSDWSVCKKCYRNWLRFKKRYPVQGGDHGEARNA